jgi:hypothetical protein
MGIDRDEDGFLDRTEIEAGTDPADPLSQPPVGIGQYGPTTTAALTRVTGAFPNPLRGRTRIDFYLGGRATASISVYDLRGRRIQRLLSEELPGGGHFVEWDGRDAGGRAVSAGVYLVRLETPQTRHSLKLLRLQ